MRSLCILLATSFALPALAQPASHPYFPLAEGNVWIHDVYGDPGGHRTTTVLGWECEGDEAFWRVGVSFAPFDGSAPTDSECAVRIVAGDDGDTVEVTPLSGEGCVAIEVEPTLPTSGDLEDVTITTRQYNLRLRSILVVVLGTPIIVTDCMRVAENVGVYSRSVCHGVVGGGDYPIEQLVYAEVGGVTYGIHPDDFFAMYDPEQYMPLAVGNRWIYSVSKQGTSFPSGISYLHDYLITGFDETTGHHDLTLTRRDDGEVTATYSCEIWMDSGGRIQLSGPDECVLVASSYPGDWSFRMIGGSIFQSYAISDIPYDLLTLSFYKDRPRYGSDSPRASILHRSAYGIGLIRYDNYVQQAALPFPQRTTYTLLYADTGEAIYGVSPVASEDAPSAPDQRLSLSGHPNPFSGSAEIAFHLPTSGTARLAVYDVLGREVAVLADGRFDAGPHSVRLDGTGLPSGVYVVRVEDRTGAVATHRVTLIR